MFWLYRYAAVDRSMAGLSAENSPMLDGSSLVAAAPSSPTTESPPSTMAAHNTRAIGIGVRKVTNRGTQTRDADDRSKHTTGETGCVCARPTTCTICVSAADRPGWLMCGGGGGRVSSASWCLCRRWAGQRDSRGGDDVISPHPIPPPKKKKIQTLCVGLIFRIFLL